MNGTSQVITGLSPGNHTFAIATRYAAGTSGVATTIAPVRATSGGYRVLLTGVKSQRETRDDPFDFDGKRDEIYAAAYWVALPYRRDKPLAYAQVQTRIYGDVNQATYRIQAGSGSPMGGIMSGDAIPAGFQPVPQPGGPAYPDRFPLLVWQGTLEDTGQLVVVNPTIWESDRNNTGNLPGWSSWWSSPNGGAILRDVAYANQGLAPITPVWLGYRDESGFPFQPGMNPGQGMDRPIGINPLSLTFVSQPNGNSLAPLGLVLTREKAPARAPGQPPAPRSFRCNTRTTAISPGTIRCSCRSSGRRERHYVCHPERSEGDHAGTLLFAPLRMT